MLFIESLGKKYYCPLKRNRLVDDSNNTTPFQHIDSLEWNDTELKSGKRVKINKFPKNHKVKLFRVVSKRRTDYVATIEKCQCRLDRIVRNHITCAVLVWIYLMQKAYETGQTLYKVKKRMYSDYLHQQLKSPTLKMDIA